MEDRFNDAAEPTVEAPVTMEQGVGSANYARAIRVFQWLANRCDGAFAADGQGFSGADSPMGRALAEKSIWTPREALAGLNLVVKYRKQLANGGIYAGECEPQFQALREELRSAPRLRRSDSVAGTISVDEGCHSIILKTGYHAELVSEVHELVGAKWNPVDRQWTCNLCAVNSVLIEELAAKWGLTLVKHAGWDRLAPLRAVSADGCWLRISGVNASVIARTMAALCGQPEIGETIFRGVRVVGDTEIAIPIKSWIIRDALLWMETWDDATTRRLGWAREEMSKFLCDAYPGALQMEQSRFAASSATALSAEEFSAISPKVPVAIAERLMAHQWVAVKSLTEHTQSILADEQCSLFISRCKSCLPMPSELAASIPCCRSPAT